MNIKPDKKFVEIYYKNLIKKVDLLISRVYNNAVLKRRVL